MGRKAIRWLLAGLAAVILTVAVILGAGAYLLVQRWVKVPAGRGPGAEGVTIVVVAASDRPGVWGGVLQRR